MSNDLQHSSSSFDCGMRRLLSALMLIGLLTVAGNPAQAQTYSILHTFTGGSDGGSPYAGLTVDRPGNLYGTTSYGGQGFGTVFELSLRGAGWNFHSIYKFTGGADGEGPLSRIILGPNGTLYGTTYAGGNASCDGGQGCGTVFNLKPRPVACPTTFCTWLKTVLYRFNGGNDAANPLLGDLVFDHAGNIYGTTENGGGVACSGSGCGTVFELSAVAGGWRESVLYAFSGSDGANPYAGVVFDRAGNLYGTTKLGGPAANGTVFRLSSNGSGWIEGVVYGFAGQNDGYWPVGGLIFDPSGNLYGTTISGGANGGGIAFAITPTGSENAVFSFVGGPSGGVYGSLTTDAAGNLYGITYDDGAFGNGAVFKLSPSPNGWIYTDLHDFTGADGRCPYGNVVLDASGNLYGTTEAGGQYDYGVVWKITP